MKKVKDQIFFSNWGDPNAPADYFQNIEDIAFLIGCALEHKNCSTIVVNQTKEKFGCYDDATEILTESGWKYFKNLTYKDKVATLNKEVLEYHKPNRIFSYDYSGKMYHLMTRGVDICITPNHKLYVARGNTHGRIFKNGKNTNIHKYELTTYEKYYLKNKKFKKDAVWIGKSIKKFVLPKYSRTWKNIPNSTRKFLAPECRLPIKPFLNFLGWFTAEGTVDEKGQISIVLNGTDGGKELDKVVSIIKELNFKYKIYTRTNWFGKINCYEIGIYSQQLATWLLANCGRGVINKHVPTFIKKLNPELIIEYLKALYDGDGHKSPASHILTTISQQLGNDVQELLLKAGFSSRIYKGRSRASSNCRINNRSVESKHLIYEINWLKKGFHNTQEKGLAKSSFENLIDYSGKIYCVEAPNHIIYIRRNGKPCWCGNSVRVYITLAATELIEKQYEYAEFKNKFKTIDEFIKYRVDEDLKWYRYIYI